MAVSQQHINATTPLGAHVVPGGATFRVWAPAAKAVYVITNELKLAEQPNWLPKAKDHLEAQPDGTWTGFVPGAHDGTAYRFWVIGAGNNGFKRDPYARELSHAPAFPNSNCLVRAPWDYPWHDAAWQPPQFNDLIIYQFHIGVYYAVDATGKDMRAQRHGRFLDLLDRIEYLRDLGINAIQPMPVQEFASQFSMGYNGSDYFSPEMDYQVHDNAELRRYLAKANALLAAHHQAPLTLHQIHPGPNQLKLIIDLCHLHGIAVLLDVVYNHAGGGFDDQSLYFMDRRHFTSNNDSLYFTDQGWAGGLVFAYWRDYVRQLLIDNARFLLDEYHADGFRFDEVSVIDNHGGWSFCQDLTNTLRFHKPQAMLIAEYWNDARWLAVTPAPDGLGFDAALSDRLRDSVRGAVAQAAMGRDATINMDAIRDSLYAAPNFSAAWRGVQALENQDVVYEGRDARLARLADSNDPRSWYARSRARVAAGLLLTAPGIPMLFMGQEFLEDKNWSDNPEYWIQSLIDWDALTHDFVKRDYLQALRDVIALRRRLPALRSEAINAFHAHNDNRVIAFHRWVEGSGQDVIVIASFNESAFWGYQLGMPSAGRWREVYNSDYYDNLPNPATVGNAGAIDAGGDGMHGLPYSAHVVIPANGLVVLARD